MTAAADTTRRAGALMAAEITEQPDALRRLVDDGTAAVPRRRRPSR
jgi:hypothetical protein